MDLIGKVNRRRTPWQVNAPRLRCQDIDTVSLALRHKRRTTGLLVAPVRRNPEFRQAVHFLCTDLDFKRLSILCDDNGMQ